MATERLLVPECVGKDELDAIDAPCTKTVERRFRIYLEPNTLKEHLQRVWPQAKPRFDDGVWRDGLQWRFKITVPGLLHENLENVRYGIGSVQCQHHRELGNHKRFQRTVPLVPLLREFYGLMDELSELRVEAVENLKSKIRGCLRKVFVYAILKQAGTSLSVVGTD